jgi:hypothetical protein
MVVQTGSGADKEIKLSAQSAENWKSLINFIEKSNSEDLK